MTVVVAVAVLFAVTGSGGDVDATVTVFVMTPFMVGLTTIVTVTVAALTIGPMLHVTPLLLRTHVPCVVFTEPKPVVFGRASLSVTPLAEFGPLLCTVIVYVSICPT